MASTARVVLASSVFAVLMELCVLPAFNYLHKDSNVSTRWSAATFIGALLFLVACSNLLYQADLCCLTYDTGHITTTRTTAVINAKTTITQGSKHRRHFSKSLGEGSR